MEFIFVTEYGQKATTTMAHVLRKTVRQKHSKRSHIFGWIAIILAVLLTLPTGDKAFALDAKTVFTYLVVLIMLCVLIFEDRLNGYIARKRMLKGTDKSKVTFREDGYFSETEMGNTEWKYDKIGMLAETSDYFVFIFSPSHAQVYDKTNLAGGTPEQFKEFIQAKTNKKMIFVK